LPKTKEFDAESSRIMRVKTKAPLDKGAGLYDPKICDIIAKTNV